MPRGQAKRSPYIRAIDWEPHRREICELYGTKPLEKVQAVMKRKHEFNATISQYKRQLGIWKVAKNARASDQIAHNRPTKVVDHAPAQLGYRDTCRRFALFAAGWMTLDEETYDILRSFDDLPYLSWLSIPGSVFAPLLESLSSDSLMVFFTLLAMLQESPGNLGLLRELEGIQAINLSTWIHLVLVIMHTEPQVMTICKPKLVVVARGLTQIVTDRTTDPRTAEDLRDEVAMVLDSQGPSKETMDKLQHVWRTQRSKLDMSWCMRYINKCEDRLESLLPD